MFLNATRNFKLYIALFLIISVSIRFYTNIVENGENHAYQSVRSKLTLQQPSKERHISSSDRSMETKNISDKTNIFLRGETNMSELTDIRLNDGSKGFKYGAQFQKFNTSRIGNSKTEADNCTKKEVLLSQTNLPITGLVSFPGSGNTWTRHLIQQMTGIGTSSVYCDGSLKVRGFPHECQHDMTKTVVVKTHETRHFNMFTKIVLLLRNPYDALLSFANFKTAGHTGHIPEKVLIKASNRSFELWLRKYVNLTRSTIKAFKGPVHVIQYETLQTNMSRELKKLASFFDLNISDRDIECTVKLQEGNFHRLTNEKQHVELLRAVYSKEKLLRLREAARYSEKMLKDAYNIDIDLGGHTEKILLQGF
ncbi:WSCD family member GA21586-like [Ruditapes philippinarum]|uniref:WSCD family member GA21586-like n=1 Tax=Ruditapes philippinarum TaxID=129788 RepID=UPI00295AA206|nr:WSCD family member GA21586-like [Ruditapes philippinarum]